MNNAVSVLRNVCSATKIVRPEPVPGCVRKLRSVKVMERSTDWLSYEPISGDYGLPRVITLVIPGNPGIVEFYDDVCRELYRRLPRGESVWAVSHACHSMSTGVHDKYAKPTVDYETQHKLAFIRSEVPEGARLRLIGHSIGCEMIVRALRKIRLGSGGISSRVEIGPSLLIFPTIERMTDTPRAKAMRPLTAYVPWLGPIMARLVWTLPTSVREAIMRHAVPYGWVTEGVYNGIRSVTLAGNVRHMLELLQDELETVVELDVETLSAEREKLVVVYAKEDGWAPRIFGENLSKKAPDTIAVRLRNENVEHAFVTSLSSVEYMADMMVNVMEKMEGKTYGEKRDGVCNMECFSAP